jgi:hypothetical protein
MLTDWRAVADIAQSAVSHEAAALLQRLGFAEPPTFDAAKLVKAELGADKTVDPESAARLGAVLDEDFVNALPWTEQHELLKAAAGAKFRMSDGSWREARVVPRDAVDADEEERRILGEGCAGFINGDERLAVQKPDGASRVRRLPRDAAADDFNAGRTRFLVSTEAGGEGIDLQERCATLVHVDLPWNPMRLHQRVGRLNRYGQKRAVRVFLLRNPSTVEARIWALLEAKLARIQAALSASMEEAEDIAQLVIGMQGGRFFDELFAEAATAVPGSTRERLGDWFDARTATFGGRDALETVRAMLGQVARFDFGAIGGSIPRIDLPALEPFFRNAMVLMGRRVMRGEEGLSVATPEHWKRSLDLRPRYDGLVFDRSLPGNERMNRLLADIDNYRRAF